jgi:hypothetical protein
MATCNARDFADSLKKPEETCAVLDALEHNSSLTSLNLQGETGMQANVCSCRAQAAVAEQEQMLCL